MKQLLSNCFSKAFQKSFLPFAAIAMICAAIATTAQSTDRPLKLALAPRSTADPVEIMKHLSQSCPNITITTSQKNSDFMLYAGGWSGSYRFMVIQKGGDVIY